MNVTAIVNCMTEAELPFVKEAIHSVQTQPYAGELLVMVPEANATILSYFRGFGSAFTLYPTHMRAAGIVRYLGVARATKNGSIYQRGDVWDPTKTERQLVVARKTGRAFEWHALAVICEDGTPFFDAFAKRMPMPSSWLVKRDLLVEDPFYDERVFQDAELWERIERKGVRTYTFKGLLCALPCPPSIIIY